MNNWQYDRSKPTSQHCKGEAVDFGYDVDNKEVATKIKDEFAGSIDLEYYKH